MMFICNLVNVIITSQYCHKATVPRSFHSHAAVCIQFMHPDIRCTV